MLVLSYAPQEERLSLTRYRCHQPAQPDEQQQQQRQQQSDVKQEHDQKAASGLWLQDVSYSAVSAASGAAQQILSSADGMLAGLLMSQPGTANRMQRLGMWLPRC